MSAIADGLPAEVHRKIVDAFETFDHEHNKTVDMRDENVITPNTSFLWCRVGNPVQVA